MKTETILNVPNVPIAFSSILTHLYLRINVYVFLHIPFRN